MLTIGEFSRICFVSKKTLRHYDEIGLLRPEHTGENGYRFYTAGQLHTMLLISRLKSYGCSLPEIAAVLANPDKLLLAEKLAEKHSRMQRELLENQRLLLQMEQDIHKLKRRMDIMEQNIIVKTAELPSQKIYGVRQKIDVNHFSEIFARLFREIGQKNIAPIGPPIALYHDEEFDASNGDIEVAVPVCGKVDGSRELAGGLHCFATLVGPYVPEAFTATYAGLCEWIEANGYHISGSPFDKYVKGGDGVPPEDYITEIYFPIAK